MTTVTTTKTAPSSPSDPISAKLMTVMRAQKMSMVPRECLNFLVRGRAQAGQLEAVSDTWCPHSGHSTKAMRIPPSDVGFKSLAA